MKKLSLALTLFIYLGATIAPVAMTATVNAAAYKQQGQRQKISARQAASIVKSRFGGKVLKVQSSGNDYRVKLIKSDGRIISVKVDGQTGRIKG